MLEAARGCGEGRVCLGAGILVWVLVLSQFPLFAARAVAVELTDKDVSEFRRFLEMRKVAPKVEVGAEPEILPSRLHSLLDRFEGVKFGGYLDGYIQYESVNPGAGDQSAIGPMDFNKQVKSFAVRNMELWIQKKVPHPGDIGFKITLNWGDIARYLTPFAPVRDDTAAQPNPPASPTGGRQTTFSEGYVLWNIPIGKGITAKFGKFSSWIGYEDWETIWNPNFSASYINAAGTPNTNTGLGLSYPVTDRLAVSYFLTNTFDTFVNNNKSMMHGLQFEYNPPDFGLFKKTSITLDTVWGPANAGNDRDWYQVYDLTVSFFPFEKLTWVTNGNINLDPARITQPSGRSKNDNKTWGIAQYFIYEHTDRLGLALRGEYFWDRDNLQNLSGGGGTSLAEVTGTINFKVRDKLMIRPEIRYDKVISAPNVSSHLWHRQNKNITGLIGVSYEF